MSVLEWTPGTEYPPGSLVRAPNVGAVTKTVLSNPDFESGASDWTLESDLAINATNPYAGTNSLEAAISVSFPFTEIIRYATNNDRHAVVPGQSVRVEAQAEYDGKFIYAAIGVAFFDSGGTLISREFGNVQTYGLTVQYRLIEVAATAPAGAATCTAVVRFRAVDTGGITYNAYVDNIVWSHSEFAELGTFNYQAVQASTGYSGTSEPVWPTVLGGTVVDNEVTWEAVDANLIVWEAKPILKSGSVEPTWPTVEDAAVVDNTVQWVAKTQRITDENCPNSKYVTITAGKVFAGDDDIVAFSATVNPLDWSSINDAGYIPFGLNDYGSEPISAIGLYRSNLVVFNTEGFQMWQVDADPQNFALLDALPLGCPYNKSLEAVGNDLMFCSEEGVRNIGIAGASTNLQAGVFGKQVDPVVKAGLAGLADDDDMISLYYPGAGQYWLIFGAEAFVLTMNGGKRDMSWSRYVFPHDITDWALKDGDLYLRAGDLVWKVDENILVDDAGGDDDVFTGRLWWPYLDFGALGQDKEMIGFDTVAEGQYDISFGYDQSDDSVATAPFTITDGDTLYGDIVPFELVAPSIQMRLTFAGNQSWEWSASTIYLKDWRKG